MTTSRLTVKTGELAMTYDFNDTTPISKHEYYKIERAAFAEYEKILDAAIAGVK